MTIDPGHLGDMLSALLDGELSPPEVTAAEEHLRACPVCRAELDSVSGVRDMVRGLPAVDPPFGLIDRIIIDQRRSGATAGARHRRLGVWLAGAAAAVAVAVLGVAPRRSQSVHPPVAQFVDYHAASMPGADPVSGLAPAAVPVSFQP